MSDNVRAIRADVIVSEGKQTLLDTVADAYDELVARAGVEPVAIIFALVTETGGGRTGYHTLATVGDRSSLYVARGMQILELDAAVWDEDAQDR